MTSARALSAVAGRQGATDLQPLVKNWWMMAGRGILAVLFGAAITLWRTPVFDAVIISFGTYAIADGLLAIAAALRVARAQLTGWPVALEGVISIVLGVLAFVWPPFPRGAIRVLVAWGLLTGMCEVVAAARLPRQLAVHWLLATAGAFSIFLALAVLFLPHAGSDRVALVVGAYAIVFGIVILLVSLRFRLVQLGAERSP
jgi:uncharacterized membrane protein HdeD (DUF308 family)